MLESLISDRSKGKKTLRKDIDTKHLEAIEQFHTNSFFWTYLLNFTGKLIHFTSIKMKFIFKSNKKLRLVTKMLRPLANVVQRVLLRNDHGQKNTIPDRNVNAVDTNESYPGHQRPIAHGVCVLSA